MNSLSAYMPQDNQELFRKGLKAGLWMDESFDWYPEEDIMSHPNGEIRDTFTNIYPGAGNLFEVHDQEYLIRDQAPKSVFSL